MGGSCSGALIHPEVVVYAGHCGTGFGDVRFGDDASSGYVVATTGCVRHPMWSGAFSEWGYALCTLAAPVTDVAIVPPLMGCETDILVPGRPVVVVGWGWSSEGAGAGVKRQVPGELSSLMFGGTSIAIDGLMDGQGACPGDSGGPTYIQLDDLSWRQLGVHHTAGASCDFSDGVVDKRLYLAVDWIESETGHDVTPCHDADGTWNPGPLCDGLPLEPALGGGSWPTCPTRAAVGPIAELRSERGRRGRGRRGRRWGGRSGWRGRGRRGGRGWRRHGGDGRRGRRRRRLRAARRRRRRLQLQDGGAAARCARCGVDLRRGDARRGDALAAPAARRRAPAGRWRAVAGRWRAVAGRWRAARSALHGRGPMRVLVFGNSGSGKSTYARSLARAHGLTHVDLDTIVSEPGQIAVQRPAAAIAASLRDILDSRDAWVIEGCYGELIEAAATHATELVFLNPGLEACLANNRRRPWEPHKYASAAEQDAMLERLQACGAECYTRDDAWSERAHRRIFDAFAGDKCEHAPDAGAWQAERRGRTLLAGGRALGWSEWGPRDGAPVLFCPGAATSSRLAFGREAAAELGLRVIALDRPGLGASQPSPGRTLLDWSSDVAAFIAARGLAAPAIIGFSQGAPFALACAAAGLVSRVALVSAGDELAHPGVAALLPPEVRALVERAGADPAGSEALFAAMTPERFHAMVVGMCPEGDRALYLAPDFDAAFRQAIDEAFAQGAEGYARDTLLAMSRWPFDPARVAVPVDLWYGALDTSPVHSPDHGAALAARLPAARRHVVPDAGGAVLWTHARDILQALAARPPGGRA
jgi:pimeloyl-ACP methyl ester carboxylesterase/adenylate kinase family enzyme